MICPNCGKQAGEGRCPSCGGVVSCHQVGLSDMAFIHFADGQIGDGLNFVGPQKDTAPASSSVAAVGQGAPVRPSGPDYGRLMCILVALNVALVSALAVLILCLLIFMR